MKIELQTAADRLISHIRDALGINRLETERVMMFHYCGSAGFLGISQSKNIRATHLRFMNDPDELTFAETKALELISKADQPDYVGIPLDDSAFIARRGSPSAYYNSAKIYSASFCENSEDLNCWRQYGANGRGFAIAFSQSRFTLDYPRTALIRVIYDEKRQDQLLEKWIVVARQLTIEVKNYSDSQEWKDTYELLKTLIRWLDLLLCAFTTSYYVSEAEWRLVKVVEQDDGTVASFLATPDNRLKAYIDIPLVPFDRGLFEGIIAGSNVTWDVVVNVVVPLCGRFPVWEPEPWFSTSRVRITV